MSFLKIQLISFIAKTTLKHSLNVYELTEHRGFVWCLTNSVYSGSRVVTSWPSPSLAQPQCTLVCLLSVPLPSQLHVCDHALPSRPFSCPALWDRIQKQDGFMAHHFYYGYLLLPCCVGKTNVVRFRLETLAKPSRAACGSLSQQHPALCLDRCRGSKQVCSLLICCSTALNLDPWAPGVSPLLKVVLLHLHLLSWQQGWHRRLLLGHHSGLITLSTVS